MLAPTPLLALLLATSSNGTYTPTFPAVGLIAWIVCYKTRRQEIGGFLMFYYWHLYSGLFISLLMFGMNFESYVPESFVDPKLYHLFLVSVVPLLIVFCIQVFVATVMLSVRTWDMLLLLRNLLVVELIFALFGLAIHVVHFPENVPFDMYNIVLSSAWIAYFFFSKRVAHVFRLKDWGSVADRLYPLKTTQRDKAS
jgi:hypothetical protein